MNFYIPYLSGSAAGPIVWDNVTIGGYTIGYQALGSISICLISHETPSSNFYV